ncbi:hypothetical protein BJ944DRAFT_240536 [Cunninghamella echinulata]|nr:hypothetical protein BJ944DRAFT_240536 [Cunninghamella echinulata]
MYYSKLEKSWLDSRISHELVSLLTSEVSNIVAPSSSTIKSECSSTNLITTTTCIPPLHDFIDLLTRRSRTKTGTLLIAFILLNRLSYRLGYVTTGMASAPQRIFLASLIISTKLINDTSPKNKHWMTFANDYFELNEINLMEKQFLTLMDFNLSITEKDFQQAVNRYKQLQKYGRHHSNMNNQQYHHHHQYHLKNNNKNKNNNSNTKRKSNQWQGTTITPDFLVTPVRNVASSISNKHATLTRSSSSSMVISTSSSSTSIASSFISPPPPLYESSLSNSSSSSTLQSYSPSSPMNIISSSSSSLHNSKFDNHSNFKWCHQQQQQQQSTTTRYISPLFST